MSWPSSRRDLVLPGSLLALLLLLSPAMAAEVDVAELTATIRAVGPGGEGHEAAIAAWKELATAEAAQLPEMLRGFSGAGPLAVNWLRPAVDTVAERELAAGGELPLAGLEQVVHDRELNPLARLVAYEWVVAVDPLAEERLLGELLEDPSLELRRLAVADVLAQAGAAVESGETERALELYINGLIAARDIDQIEAAAAALVELGEPVNLTAAFGFVTEWQVIGPFPGSVAEGFEQVYPPEEAEGGQVDLAAEYEGLEEPVAWQAATTEDPHGMLDLNAALGQHIEAVAYAYAEIESEGVQAVELRLGSQNGTKVWLNGELVSSNAIYHTGANIDQYVGRGELRPGVNTILVKIHQDDPGGAPWAGAWGFQLRAVDALGAPIQQTENRE